MRRTCLFVSALFPPPLIGGSLVYYFYLLSRCTSQDVVVVTRLSDGCADLDAGVPYTICRSRSMRDAQEPRLGRVGWYALLFPLMLFWIVRFRASVVHLGIWRDVIPGWVASRLTRRPLIVTILGEELTTELDDRRNLLFRSLWHLHDKIGMSALRGAQCVLTCSCFTKSVLLERGIRENRIVVLTPGVDLDKVGKHGELEPAVASRLMGKRVLLTVGRLEARKGQDMVLQAVSMLRAEYPQLHYVMAGGGDAETRRHLEALIQELGLEDSTSLLENLDNSSVSSLYAVCEVFIMPNRTLPNGDTEGYGIVFLEAGAWGKPVIGGRAGGVVEAVEDGVTGILVDGTDVKGIAQAISRLLDDPELARQMGEAGMKKVAHADWGVKSEEYRALINRLAAGSGLRQRGLSERRARG